MPSNSIRNRVITSGIKDHQYAVFLTFCCGALALQAAEEEEGRQLMARMHYVQMQGMQWEWHWDCKGMLEGWVAERCTLKLQTLERQSRWGG